MIVVPLTPLGLSIQLTPVHRQLIAIRAAIESSPQLPDAFEAQLELAIAAIDDLIAAAGKWMTTARVDTERRPR